MVAFVEKIHISQKYYFLLETKLTSNKCSSSLLAGKNKVIDEKETFTNTKQIYLEGKE